MQDLSRLFSLEGRKAIVTGASRGLGRAIARTLAAAGATVGVTARETEALHDTIEAICESGGKAEPAALDVREVGAVRDAIEDLSARLGGIDILINNAGYEEVSPSLDVDEALWDRIVDTNLKGAFFCAQAAARLMTAAGHGGSIVNLCSLTSYVGIPTAVPYGSSKSGLLGMTRALAAEWAPAGIRVNAVAPGYFRTDMTEVFYSDETWEQTMLGKIPLRRFGRMEDLSGAVLFLAGDASAYVTGQCIPVDGGFLASI